MPDPIVQDPPVVVAPVVTPVAAEPDLMTKVTNFKPAVNGTPAAEQMVDIGFDFKELDAIKDPQAKEVALKAYKSMQAGATKKFQEAAQTRKDAEALVAQSKNWSPERIRNELLNNPEFLAAASQVAGATPQQNPPNSGLTNEEFSALTDKEKSEFSTLKSEISTLKQVNFQALMAQTDAVLQTKFSDYNSTTIDRAIGDLSRLSPHQIREHVYKSVNHDKHVQDAYDLGKKEALDFNKEKISAISTNGTNTINNDGLPTRTTGESDVSWFSRLGQFRLSQFGRK